MNTVWRVFAYLKRYPVLAISMLACAIIGTLMIIVFPAVNETDYQRSHQSDIIPERLLPAGVGSSRCAFFLQHGLNSLRLLLNNTFEQKVIFDLRSDLYSHIQLLPLRWFDNRATGDLMTRILEDVTSVERVLIDGIDQGTVAVLQILIVLAGDVLSQPQNSRCVGLAPVPFLAGGALVVHAHGTSAVSTATPRCLRHEFTVAR